MDTKPKFNNPNTRNVNRNYITEQKTDYFRIDKIYSEFSTSEYPEIATILQSDMILNFRTEKGETLIHAILRNPSTTLTEQQIKTIIEQLVHKNVSINAMNEYNQTSIHLAAQRGFYDVIQYLISLHCDFNKIDNYGNAPLHYLIDNFITDCKENQYYKTSNKKIKYNAASKLSKYEKITEKLLILSLINQLETIPVSTLLMKHINQITELFIPYNLTELTKLINIHKLKINDLYRDHESQTIKSDTQTIIAQANTDITRLYKEFIIKPEDLSEQKINDIAALLQATPTPDVHKTKSLNKINDIIKDLDGIYEKYVTDVLKILHLYYYIGKTYTDTNDGAKICSTIFFAEYKPSIYIAYDKILNNTPLINPKRLAAKFIRHKTKSALNEQMDLTIDMKNNVGHPYVIDIFNDNNDMILYAQGITGGMIYKPFNVSDISAHFQIDANHYCRFTQACKLILYMRESCVSIKNYFEAGNFDHYYVTFQNNFVNETVLNVINNLTILQTELNYLQRPINQIISDYNQFTDILKLHKITAYNFLFSQINTDEIKKNYDKNQLDTLQTVYKTLIELTAMSNEYIEFINSYYSLEFLKTYNNFINSKPSDLTGFINNMLFTIDSQYPSSFIKYASNVMTPENIIALKNKHLVYYNGDKHNTLYYNTTVPITITYKRVKFDDDFRLEDTQYTVNIGGVYHTGFNVIQYNDNGLDIRTDKSIMAPTNIITDGINMMWAYVNRPYNITDDGIPIIALSHSKELLTLIISKICNVMKDNNLLKPIIESVIDDINKLSIPKETQDTFLETFNYIKDNENILEMVIKDKLISLINTYIKLEITKHVNHVTQKLLIDKLDNSIYDRSELANLKSIYQLNPKSESLDKLLLDMLGTTGDSIFGKINDTLINVQTLETTSLNSNSNKKLLINKCSNDSKIDSLRNLHFNFRVLDRNGNTIINRLIDQFNIYAIEKVLKLDPSISSYENNRGQNSQKYLIDVMKTIADYYSNETITKRYNSYAINLQEELKSAGLEDIELDEQKGIVQNIIRNSLYIFNEFIWLKMLGCPNGWTFSDKDELINIVSPNVKETLLIQSITPSDYSTINELTNANIIKTKLSESINKLNTEISELTNSKKQYAKEKQNKTKLITDSQLDIMVDKVQNTINNKQSEIIQFQHLLESLSSTAAPNDLIISCIHSINLITETSINFKIYNDIAEKLWNNYLRTIAFTNSKNDTDSYISNFNLKLLTLNLTTASKEQINILTKYNTSIINDIYGDFYDLDKYEDSEYNYTNRTILNIIYLNVINILAIEMFSGIIRYIHNRYIDQKIIKKIIDNHETSEGTVIFNTIKKLLKQNIIEKLQLKNPEKKYPDIVHYKEELTNAIYTQAGIPQNDIDSTYINKIIDFYTFISNNISYNIYQEITAFLDNLKKRSLLTEILKLIHTD
ncbi:MAG: hypothetical protein Gaeavirus9_13 [Gaeavirus sp.]|uniref:Uncharacterized protein n=1 Tax=Gaeavirus sp. TaxID=2487767 RepID=A0A3G5A2Q1_9VIRU|nr:MAG: hypothetical protein Gaeavirus9_13 [Gaeavirus sp.]